MPQEVTEMPLPKAYEALIRSRRTPNSNMETFSRSAEDPFTDYSVEKCKGLTYAQMVELYTKRPDLYEQLFRDSAWD